MNYDFYIKQNDTWPPLKARLLDADDVEIPVGDAQEIRLVMTKKNNRRFEIINSTNLSVVTDTEGKTWVVYYWEPDDTKNSGGYQAEFVVILADGNVVTVPNKNDEYVMILIGNELG